MTEMSQDRRLRTRILYDIEDRNALARELRDMQLVRCRQRTDAARLQQPGMVTP